MKRKICRGGAVKAEGMAVIFNTLLDYTYEFCDF